MTAQEKLDKIIDSCCHGCGVTRDSFFERSFLGSIAKEAVVIVNEWCQLMPACALEGPLNVGHTRISRFRTKLTFGESNPMALTLARSIMRDLRTDDERQMALLKAVILDTRLDLSPGQLLTLQTIIKENL